MAKISGLGLGLGRGRGRGAWGEADRLAHQVAERGIAVQVPMWRELQWAAIPQLRPLSPSEKPQVCLHEKGGDGATFPLVYPWLLLLL